VPRFRLLAAALAALALSLAAAGVAPPAAGADGEPDGALIGAPAHFQGPIETGHVEEPLSAVAVDLAAHHYVEQEYFASGTATAYRAAAEPADGHWTVAAASHAPYRTRIIVRRPADPAHFSGTVVVEWLNVSAGESSPDWDYLNPSLVRAGDAWVGVSAQALAVQGGTALLGSTKPSSGLVGDEPARYGTLHHPGDQYALDLFAQIGAGLRHDPAVFGPLRPTRLLAVGESQSAFYLTTFVDALAPADHDFAGYFIHSRGGNAAPLNGSGIGSDATTPGGLRIRTDLPVPVFMFETQTDATLLGFTPALQPDTNRIRTWEVAGTSHADAYLVGPAAGVLGCPSNINDGPQHIVVQAAFSDFVRWASGGSPPREPAFFQVASHHPVTLALDAHGNVIGGVRTPAVDAPISALSGSPQPGASAICGLFGSTTPFSPATLTSLYHSKATYLQDYTRALDRAIRHGYVLAADRAGLLAQAQQVSIPG
jgi:hypothetical protein